MKYQLALSPGGRLLLEQTQDGSESLASLVEAFGKGSAEGIVALVAEKGGVSSWPAEATFWREFGRTFVHGLAHAPEPEVGVSLPVASPDEYFFSTALGIPVMRGAEYGTPGVMESLWRDLEALAQAKTGGKGEGIKAWLRKINPALHLVGRVTFHLAENKKSPDKPFAFMASFTHRLTAQDKPMHLPLGRALQEYAGAKNQAALRTLLEPVQRAAEVSDWAREMVESQRIFQPQAWSPAQAHAFLKQVPKLEDCGIIARIPNWWRSGRGPRPGVKVTVGEGKTAGLGLNSMLKFSAELALDGVNLTEVEWNELLNAEQNLVLVRGQWVEVDKERLQEVLRHWKQVQAETQGGVGFLQGMRLLSGVRELGAGEDGDAALADWSHVTAGDWLRETLEKIRDPQQAGSFDPNLDLQASLRPYQALGVRWMWFLQSLGLGACLADDMGLGKTIQVIALLLQLRRESAPPAAAPTLLIAPASLLANWRRETTRFAPSLRVITAHPSEPGTGEWRQDKTADHWLVGADLVLTTYSQIARLPWLSRVQWRLVVLDEAQAIKNPGAGQTRAVKKLKAQARIALSGTPVENRPGDLWSLYDFLNPGLLGGPTEFSRYVKAIQKAEPPDFAPLRRLVQPYILRRMKTDRSIIADLPDKTEMTVSCSLSPKQAALYQTSVIELSTSLAEKSGIERRGLVLAFLMRFKQICNHPSQWNADGSYEPEQSGKFTRLTELCEEVASRQEKALIFTQYQEMTGPLEAHLQRVFGRPGLILHGGTPVKERGKLVEAFQRDDGPPFFVLSLKAGGSGLTLTAASHVFHFDRWWNPAVENQATDRAFRIGQKRNVLVHKFVCQGTLEERIDAMLQDKRALADSLLGAANGAETLLTEMSNDELLRFVSLDLTTAAKED